MSELDQLTAAQLREAARVLGDWIREERHRAEVEAEMLDEDGALACREVADRVRAVQVALQAEAAHREAGSGNR
jgi:Sec-independent protein translocase protein TatA